MTFRPVLYKFQSGVVLVVALIMLLLLALIGTAGMQSTSLEEKMAGNMRDKNLAFQAAESALSEAEASLFPVAPAVLPNFTPEGTVTVTDPITHVSTVYNGYYSKDSTIPTAVVSGSTTKLQLEEDSFWTTNPVATSTITTLGNDVAAPKYIIQKLDTVCYKTACPSASDRSTPYRITVRATGGSAVTVVIVQSVFTTD
jgi:type IV pilus assembly protein PilX